MKNILRRMDGVLGGLLLIAVAAGSACAAAQTHKVEKPETVTRAVGVYEWTGDIAKPTASRLIPVTLFIDGNLEDAGEYLARPIPFALDPGNVYELDQAGISKGTLDLVYARHLKETDSTGAEAYDGGWFGYGSFKAAPPPRPATALKKSKTLSVLSTNANDTSKPQLSNKTSSSSTPNDPDRPTMKRRDDSSASSESSASSTASNTPASNTTPSTASSSSTPADDPDRPTMKRRDDSSASSGTTAPNTPASSTSPSTASTGSVPADDPDRPTMKRRTTDDSSSGSSSTSGSGSGSGTSTASTTSDSSTPADDPDRPTMKRRSDDSSSGTTSGSTTTASTGSTPANDPDRPTLKRRTPEEMKQARKDAGLSSVAGIGALNDDPNRPTLHHGKPTADLKAEDVMPQLKGMPPVDTQQMVAVSDPKNRTPHDFARPWDDDAERTAVLAKMETMARAQLTAYEAHSAAATAPAAAKKPATHTATTARTVKKPAAATPEPLVEEQLKGYTLSYGGSPTYVFQAQTAGDGVARRYVTVVAQPDGTGELQPVLKSVTDAGHLDRTPRLRLVDAVDVQASNRASLLFEMRGQTSRQFALYRVIGARADQIFLSGTTQ